MPKFVTLSRDSGARHVVARSTVKAGQLFKVIIKDRPGDVTYLAIGNNGRWLSLNLANNGALASTDNGDKHVQVVGKAALSVKFYDRGARKAATRSALVPGQVFQSSKAGATKTYMHLGKLNDDRWAGLNLSDPFNDDYSVATNGNGNVVVIGEAHIAAEVI